MSGTFTQLQIHIVFSVKGRQMLINESIEEKLYKFISGVIKNNGHKLLQINGMPDHVHILISISPNQSISELVKYIKQGSSHMINSSRLIRDKFSWQSGYAAFSCSKSHSSKVINYIKNQKIHHQKKSFLQEYKTFLDENNVIYDTRFI
ncbi:IS200/IS605 family transposase [Fulvivirga sedimenti]|uniref:IS200/IS605 family transposase n=1 Tax=Fulvivirga sedimenti TaxID=2879465 RepID=A0A9X1HKX2_9BACT|nr:IS200/IS605 family transposase [Fulvivirga sedimenti]MCA6073226.1 IS200/IS605 family transposase [Fulvivirga sedimenti]